MKKLRNILIFTTITAALFVVLYIAYLLLYPVRYFETEQPYKILNPNHQVKIGENLIYEAKYCKYVEYIPQRVQRSLVDGYVYDLPISTSGNFKKGCHTVVVTVPMVVPESLPTDHVYHLQIAIEYKLNQFRTENRTFVTEEFTIVK